MADYTQINNELNQFLREANMMGLASHIVEVGDRSRATSVVPGPHVIASADTINRARLVATLIFIHSMIRADVEDPILTQGLRTLKKIRGAAADLYNSASAELGGMTPRMRIAIAIDELDNDAASEDSNDSEVIVNGLAAPAITNRFNLGNNNAPVVSANSLAEKRKVIAIAAYKNATGAVLKGNDAFIQSGKYWTSGRYILYQGAYTDIALTGKSVGFIKKADKKFAYESATEVYDISGLPTAKAVFAGPAENFMILGEDDRLVFARTAADGTDYGVYENVLKASSPADYARSDTNRKPGAVILLKTGEVIEVGGTSADLTGYTAVAKPDELRLKDVCMGLNYYIGIDMNNKIIGWGNFMKEYGDGLGIIPKIAASITYTPKKVFTCNFKVVIIDSEDLIHIYELMTQGMIMPVEAREVDIPEPYKSIKVLDIACANDVFVALTDQEKLYASQYDDFRKYTDERGPLYDSINLLEKYTDTRVLEARFDKVVHIVANEGISGAVTEEGHVYAWGRGSGGVNSRLDTFGGEEHFDIDKLAFTFTEGAVLDNDGRVMYWDSRGRPTIANKLPADHRYSDIVGSETYFVGLDEEGKLHSSEPTSVPLPTGKFTQLYCNGTQGFVFWKEDETVLCYNDSTTPAKQPPAGVKFREVALTMEPQQYIGIEADTNRVVYWGQNSSSLHHDMPTTARSIACNEAGQYFIVDMSGKTIVYDSMLGDTMLILKDIDIQQIRTGINHYVALLTNGHVVSGKYDDGTESFGTSRHTTTDLSVVDSRFEHYTLEARPTRFIANNDDSESGSPRARSPRAQAVTDLLYFRDHSELYEDTTFVLPRLEKVEAAEVPKPNSRDIFDFATGNDYDDYIEFLEEEQGDAIIFKLSDKLMGGSKKAIANSIADDSAVFYECRKVFPFNPDAGELGTFEPSDIKRLSIVMINLNGRFYFRTPQVLELFATNQFFEIEETDEKIPVTASRGSAIEGGPIMSANHCQEGTNIKLYRLKAVKFIATASTADNDEEEEAIPNIVYVRIGEERVPIDVPGKTTVKFVREKLAEIRGVGIDRIKLIKFGGISKNTNVANPGDNFMAIIKATEGGGSRRNKRHALIGGTRRLLRKDITSRF